MSLDVDLVADGESEPCPHCGGTGKNQDVVFSANVTHNLNKMAMEAGIYQHLWRPEELGITKAKEIIGPLQAGLALMEADPVRFIALEPENKWGTYHTFLPWIREYLKACEKHPEAKIKVSR